ncbi:M56 family metallopeptidase [Aquimarina muelleri]|uniref:Peptidase M56 domain-containing protein n=1 Tax=Aquimarina muelleri TaxID=279356 RepID=A0A918JV94_9FLAO|nr:M56 family metallopeptidase [Aquimarina muelleri]MCX2763968.1 M56 family metallopeptidase [Aquimarina muelleri]GGX22187.1 hypothetical protein GCM10007384_24240 [Aquimarina muelleri]
MVQYILQILILQISFLAIYDFLLKKDTFFNWNRIYLILTPIASLILPFIKIDFFKTETSQVYVSKLERIITVSSENITAITINNTSSNTINWWLIAYFTGVLTNIIILALKLYKLNILKSIATKTKSKNNIVILPNSSQAFSFWNTIYIGDALNTKEKEQILIHETVHLSQKHSLDQIWFELLKIVLWWNPIIYIYQSRVTILHEYIADAIVVKTINKKTYIQQLLNTTFQTQEIPFINQFYNQSLIKKRILMLLKTKSKTTSKFKYLILAPVLIGILIYTSCSDNENQIKNSTTIENSKNLNSSKPLISQEPKCPNQNSLYEKKLDNYLSIRNGKNHEAIINIISVETSKKIRTIYFSKNQTYFSRNIPEGKYKLHITYGEDYAEKMVDGKCLAYFKNEKEKVTNENLFDFNGVKTDTGYHTPSYSISLDKNFIDPNRKETLTTRRTNEPECPNQNAEYNNELDNYLKITSSKNSESIIHVTSIKSSKSIRTIHLGKNQIYLIKNIPEGKYQLHITYGKNYSEKTINGECIAYFKIENKKTINKNILDFNTLKTDRGLNVPSYNLDLSIDDNK